MPSVASSSSQKRIFKPRLVNYKTSLSYEGLVTEANGHSAVVSTKSNSNVKVNDDIYTYQGSGVLKNSLNIRDAEELQNIEISLTTERYLCYQSKVTKLNQLDFSHLKNLHFHLFRDVYSWAGEVRDINIAKRDTLFCLFGRIEPEAAKLFSKIPALSNPTSTDELIEKLASLFCELNLLHPFRDGNGRALRFFFEELLFTLGYEIHWPALSQHDWIEANIAGVHQDLEPLASILSEAMGLK
ncbi:Fic/DOC family protein [Vibrio agarivorans]|uniref:Fic/DOC family protein n=1 Tax=Vibrio agarivorans TaxID=153622 RepID=UPI0025B485A7|nr:Fic family protein [Vibrio agarivorans]MDN3660674.1 Fic family protein [Vibrio agarivorans]